MQFSSTYSCSDLSSPTHEVEVVSSDGPLFITRPKLSNQRDYFKSSGEWSSDQMSKFIVFCRNQGEEPMEKAHNCQWKFFKKMSIFIKSRNYRQCKVFYEKLMKKYGDLNKTIMGLFQLNASLEDLVHQLSQKEQKYKNQQVKKIKGEGKDPFKTSDVYEAEIDHFEPVSLKMEMEKDDEFKVQPSKVGPGFFQEWMKKYAEMMDMN